MEFKNRALENKTAQHSVPYEHRDIAPVSHGAVMHRHEHSHYTKLMKPTKKLKATDTPDGRELILYQHGCDFSIQINRRQYESLYRYKS